MLLAKFWKLLFRLDGKKRKESAVSENSANKLVYQRGIPDYNHKIGTIRFLRNSRPPSKEVSSLKFIK